LKEGGLKPTEITVPVVKNPRARKAVQGDLFAPVVEEVRYGRGSNQRPLLYDALASVVEEAEANGQVSSWRAVGKSSIAQIRSAAAAYGYTVNTASTLTGERTFRLNGKKIDVEVAS
jgi:hypothetical protein